MVQDIILDENLDLEFKNGDFNVFNSDSQHVRILLDFNKGNLTNFPDAGLGLTNLLNSNLTIQQLRRLVNIELEKDGYTNIEVITNEDFTVSINADRIIN